MAFADFAAGIQAASAQLRQLIRCFNGDSGQGQPLNLTGTALPNNYVVDVKNLDDTNGFLQRASRANGTVISDSTKNGFRYSPDGATANQQPVSIGLAETITGAKTLSGITTFGNKTIRARGTSTPAASALTLPDNGDTIPITTGTGTINSIVASNAGRVVTLEFQSALIVVKATATLRLQGDYISVAGGQLELECDGTNWNERGRGACVVPRAKYRITAATTSIASGTERIVNWTDVEYNYGLTAVPATAIVLGILGLWKVSGQVSWDDSGAGGNHKGYLLKGGVDLLKLFGWGSNSTSSDDGFSFSSEFEVTSITDNYGLGLTSGNTCNMLGGAQQTHIAFTYLGR